MSKKVKAIGIGLGALVLSTVTIGATDLAQNVGGGLAGLVIESTGPCTEGATLISFGEYAICMDIYEASPSELCSVAVTTSELETTQNMNSDSCVPTSKPKATPWSFVSMTQAQQLCARVGKRLPSSQEWYKTVSGITNIDNCAVDTRNGSPLLSGEAECVSPSGIHDMVGNVWEWIDGELHNGQYNNRAMPESGYVASVDSTGVALTTSDAAHQDYGEDYVWTSGEGVRGMIRGGFYGSGSDGGVYTLNTAVPLDFKTSGIGFRCVQDVY